MRPNIETIPSDKKAAIRLTIVLFWTTSTVMGVVTAGYIPERLSPYILGLTFPVSALLFLLSALNVRVFISETASTATARLAVVAICACISLGLIMVVVLATATYLAAREYLPAIL